MGPRGGALELAGEAPKLVARVEVGLHGAATTFRVDQSAYADMAERVAQALVDRFLPDAPEAERIGIALAGFAGGELARLGPGRR